jgi:uncharacterized membrane protein
MFKEVVSMIGYTVEGFGIAVIVIGAVGAILRYGYRHIISVGGKPYVEFRQTMGRAMMVGLEFLVAGDIIRTVVVDHTLQAILGLGLIVLIRTVLVFTIHLELEGHWPWQKQPGHEP